MNLNFCAYKFTFWEYFRVSMDNEKKVREKLWKDETKKTTATKKYDKRKYRKRKVWKKKIQTGEKESKRRKK